MVIIFLSLRKKKDVLNIILTFNKPKICGIFFLQFSKVGKITLAWTVRRSARCLYMLNVPRYFCFASVIYVTAHRCAEELKKTLDLRSGSQRHFVRARPSTDTGSPFLYGYSKKPPIEKNENTIKHVLPFTIQIMINCIYISYYLIQCLSLLK